MPLAGKKTAQELRPPPDTFDVEEQQAYERCQMVEGMGGWGLIAAELPGASEILMLDMPPRTAARALGWALVLAPSDSGRKWLAGQILVCGESLELFAGLAHLIVFGLVRVFYNPKGPTPTLSVDQSLQESSRENAGHLDALLKKPQKSLKELRKLVSFRDEHTCPLTGDVNSQYAIKYRSVEIGRTIVMGPTQVAHIISQSIFESVRGTSTAVDAKFDWAKSAAAIVACYGGFDVERTLGTDGVHSPCNAFTISTLLHELFDILDLWLEPVQDAADTYEIKLAGISPDITPSQAFNKEFPPYVKFKTGTISRDTIIPPPDPQLIALHAACAGIAHMSGAADYIQDIFREPEPVDEMTSPYYDASHELSRALKAIILQG
ncbi:hypothetical protein EXIGLDRAFT_759852 [Exidia glandulosa HHB12029]|uniref:HNH nuclease domain-containing protein n=1 Tax=Exidia glandulosa HHB12029 TaxID=1314781 RepID=A0A165PLN9_EXIGL|nr:hypothetical protein EXIGLDRAFT_759852 [Exidia glandulosa HHB12029]